MLNIPESVKTLFKTDGTRKNFRVHFPNGELSDITNSAIVTESVHFTESLCSQNTFKFGLAERSVIEFETVGIGNVLGAQIQCSYEIDTTSLSAAQIAEIQAGSYDGTLVLAAASDIGYGYYRIPLGVFTVDSCPRNKGAMTHRKVTGYGAEYGASIANFGLSNLSYPQVSISYNAIQYLISNDTESLTEVSVSSFWNRISFSNKFYDKNSGQVFSIFLRSRQSESSNSPIIRKNIVTQSIPYVDFVKLPDDFDLSVYDEFLEAVSEAIDDAGYDFRFSVDGTQLFATTVDLLKASFPMIAGPTVATSETNYDEGCHARISKDKITPVINIASSGFFYAPPQSVGGKRLTVDSQKCYALKADAGTNYVLLSRNGANTYLPFTSPEIAEPDIEFYVAPTHLGKFSLTGTATDDFRVNVNTTVPQFSFEDVNLAKELSTAAEELSGKSIKDDRLGGFEQVTLSPSAPIAISAADTEDVWWDDYNISPVGTVAVKFSDGENDVEMDVSIGNGASVYDMADNEILNNASGMTAASVTTLINGDFKSNVANIGFTPCEMTMQGWPWMEAGDALRITAEDGTIVNTYALRIEMSGIQNILATITADGGELMTEEG